MSPFACKPDRRPAVVARIAGTVPALALAALLSGTAVPVSAQSAMPVESAPMDSVQVGEAHLPTDPLAMAIARELSVNTTVMLNASANAGDEEELELGIQGYYENRVYQPLWVSDQGLNPHGELLISAFEKAGDHALDPADYAPDRLRQLASAATDTDDLAQLEVAISNTFVTYANHLTAGRVKPNEVNRSLNLFPKAPDPAVVLEFVDTSEDFASAIDGLSPNTPNYARLKTALADYRAKEAAGGFTLVPEGETLKPGMTDTRAEVLRTRLAQQDLFTPGSHSGDVYDGALVEAVKLFQERHGLEVDGVIGKNTLAEINVPISTRIDQMELNMERRRWMPDDLGSRYVFVNLADQNLKVVENDKTVHTTRVVVGKPYHATPVFSDEMTYAEVNPYWTVPYSIATTEYLPMLQRDPGSLLAKNIRVFSGNREIDPWSVAWGSYSRSTFPFTLRQDPGEGNALGRIKFMFPNKFNIYIHDTPSKSLFDRAQRSFSHGCIRAEDPFDLGQALLGSDGWTKDKLEAIRNSGERRVIKLSKPLPVHLTYLTAWVNKDDSVHFRRDIYDRDKVLSKAIAQLRPANL